MFLQQMVSLTTCSFSCVGPNHPLSLHFLPFVLDIDSGQLEFLRIPEQFDCRHFLPAFDVLGQLFGIDDF